MQVILKNFYFYSVTELSFFLPGLRGQFNFVAHFNQRDVIIIKLSDVLVLEAFDVEPRMKD